MTTSSSNHPADVGDCRGTSLVSSIFIGREEGDLSISGDFGYCGALGSSVGSCLAVDKLSQWCFTAETAPAHSYGKGGNISVTESRRKKKPTPNLRNLAKLWLIWYKYIEYEHFWWKNLTPHPQKRENRSLLIFWHVGSPFQKHFTIKIPWFYS